MRVYHEIGIWDCFVQRYAHIIISVLVVGINVTFPFFHVFRLYYSLIVLSSISFFDASILILFPLNTNLSFQ